MTYGRFKVVSIRYNTKSDGEHNTWRVICDGVEYLTNKVLIKGTVESSKDFIEDVGFKHHVTVYDALVTHTVEFSLIESCKKTLYKDILKTITYRILGTCATFGIGFVTTGNLYASVAIGFSDLLLKPLIYFVHERLWRLNEKTK